MKTEKETQFDLKKFCEFPFPDMQQWKKTAEESLKGKSFETLKTKTYEGIELKPLYVQKDVENLSHVNDLPGEGSFVRGADYLRNSASAWDIAQEITGRSAKQFNQAIIEDLKRGQTMVNLVVDEATKKGYDADEVDVDFIGLNGVPVASINELRDALANINLNEHRLFMQTGISTLPLYASLVSYAKDQHINIQELVAFIGLDPIGTIAAAGKSKLGIKRLYNTMAQLAKWSNENSPKVKTIYIQGELYHNAGGSATEELAFALSTGVEYINEMLDRGLEIDEIANQMYFSFAVGSNVFMEIAKLRAARILWSKIVETFGGTKQSQKMYIHVRSSNWTKTIFDPYVNMLRTTTEAFAGAVGGANSMHVSPFDEAIRPEDSFSRRIARNTQIILQEESLLNQVVDPAGGSWYVESLTDAIASKAWELFQEVEKNGGMYEALKAGYIQQKVTAIANQKKANIEYRKDRIVGTNMYPNMDEKPLQIREVIEDYKASLIEGLKAKKAAKREDVIKALDEVKAAVTNDGHLVPALINAAATGATIGEMMNVLAENCKGAEVEKLTFERGAEGFEQLRMASESYKEKNGQYPRIFLTNLGPIPKHKARADFSAGFFAAGGFESVSTSGFESSEEAVKAVLESGIDIVTICGTDEQYEEIVPAIAKELKNNNKDIYIFVAGKPSPQLESQYVEAGVDEFIHVKSNCYQTLARLQERKGVN